jgi:hypothetical protein
MENGEMLAPPPAIEELRERFRIEFAALDDRFKVVKNPAKYPVRLSSRLRRLQRDLTAQLEQGSK